MKVMNGLIIDNRYEVKCKLGEGGMSSVYKVFDNRLQKIWAMKYMEVSDISSGMTEANVLRNLDHPLFPRIVDVGYYEASDSRYIYIVMDYIEGKNLDEVLKEVGSFSEDTCVSWTLEILDALNYLHNQTPPIIYRDMKPGNIMLTKEGKLKIIDFGIAREKKTGNSNDTVALGTRGYAAPEQFGGQGQSDERTDIYCLGATMYHLITGKNPCEPPYRMYPVRHVKPGLSEGVEKIIIVATRADPSRRYQSCNEMMDALRRKDLGQDNVRILKLHVSKVLMLVGIVLFIAVFPLEAYKKQKIMNSYDDYLKQSLEDAVYGDRIVSICKAIELNPSRIDGYLYLFDLYAEDEVFSESEEMRLLSLWDDYGKRNLTDDDKAFVSYRIGILYWFYYLYGRESELNIKQSIPWFQEATKSVEGEYKDIANIYYLIGSFHRDITGNTNIANDTYLEYFANLEKLILLVEKEASQNKEEQIIIRQWIKNTVDSYYEDFINAGVVDERISHLLDSDV